jgi:hypothetical protein
MESVEDILLRGEFDGEKKNAWIDTHFVVQIY